MKLTKSQILARVVKQCNGFEEFTKSVLKLMNSNTSDQIKILADLYKSNVKEMITDLEKEDYLSTGMVE